MLTAVGTVVSGILIHNQERRLLDDRANEISLILTTTVNSIVSSLDSLAAVVHIEGVHGPEVQKVAASLSIAASATPANRPTMAVVAQTSAGWQVEAVAGNGLRVGQVLSGPAAQAVALANTSGEVAGTSVYQTGSGRTLGFALGAPATPKGVVLFRQSPLGPVSAPQAASTAPFDGLQVVLYAATGPDPNQLLLTTTKQLPLSGLVRYQPFHAGSTAWDLGVSATGPLVGTLAADVEWLVLAVGIVGSVLIAVVVEIEARRRDAAIARYASEHELAETLQRSLLPELPHLDGLDVAARYLASGAGQQVGGDWFDVFALDDGRVGMVIGDVIGHDIAAAAAMSQIRATLRAYAWEGKGPGKVLQQLDEAVDAFASAQLVTVFYGVLDRPAPDGSRRMRYANAGHLPPVIKRPNGPAELLEGATSVVIGAPSEAIRAEAEVVLPNGTMLLFFTDGLIEVPGDSLAAALSELVASVDRCAMASADALCEEVVTLARPLELRDDIAALAVRLVDAGQPSARPDPMVGSESAPAA
jgi:hypothetical protein